MFSVGSVDCQNESEIILTLNDGKSQVPYVSTLRRSDSIRTTEITKDNYEVFNSKCTSCT